MLAATRLQRCARTLGRAAPVAAARRPLSLPTVRGATLRRATPIATTHRRLSLPPHNVVSVPALSPTMETGTIARWHVAEGDAFGAGDSIAEVETDKASMEWEMQDDGVVAKHLVAPGTEVAVGTPAVVLVEDAADVGAFADFEAPAGAVAAPAPAAAPEPAPAPVAPAPVAPAPAPVVAAAPSGGRVAASPLARKEAQAKGVDLSRIVGTGPGGRVTFDDVHNAPAQAGVAQAHASDYAITPEAAYLAAKLAHSAQTAPHYYLTMDIQVGKALALLDELNAGEDAKIGLGDLFVKAAANAAVAVPDVNASWLDGVVRQYQRVDVNLVVGVGEGLRAPVLIDVASMSLKQVSEASAAAMADETPYMAGTITVQNLGAFGLSSAAPVVHTPQACCLALGAVVDAAALVDGKVVSQPKLAATLAADHRVVDGAVGAAWLAALRALVEAPAKLLL